MELVNEYIFTRTKKIHSKILFEGQSSTSSSSSSSSSSLISRSRSRSGMPTGSGEGGQEQQLLATARRLHDDLDDDGSSICSGTADSNDSAVCVELKKDPADTTSTTMTSHDDMERTCAKSRSPASSSPPAPAPPTLAEPLLAPFPLRLCKNQPTSSSLSAAPAPSSRRSSEATCFFEEQHQQHVNTAAVAAAQTAFFKNGTGRNAAGNPSTTIYNPPRNRNDNNNYGHHQQQQQQQHDNNEDDDDILGRLMSHPVTAQWMLASSAAAANHHHPPPDNRNDTMKSVGNATRNSNVNASGGSASTSNPGWPVICVVGDTSSGKSSLLCNLSGIQLPTHHQLTTRCPILLHIARRKQGKKQRRRQSQQPSAPSQQDAANADTNTTTGTITKTATIQIMWRTPNILMQQQTTTSACFWPERRLTDENWYDMSSTIFEAQAFILQQTRKQVAPDIVSVNVVYYDDDDSDNDDNTKEENDNIKEEEALLEHDEYPYLTLLDLPGLIQTAAADESPTLVQEVQALVRSYLHAPHVLVLAVVSCTTDFHNAQVLAEIFHPQNHHENGNNYHSLIERTIPVLTKPDLMDPGAAEIALRDDLLLGGKQLIPKTTTTTATTADVHTAIQSSWSDDYNGGGGSGSAASTTRIISNPFTFHMVKGRGQAALDRGDSIEQGLRDEVRFFETREPWKSVANRTLFGTRHLQAKLARLQHDIVRKHTLPRLHVDIQERCRALQMELQDLMGAGSSGCNITSNNMEMDPLAVLLDTPADRRRYYQQVCQSLMASLQASLSGKKQHHHHIAMTSTISSRTTITRSTKSVYRKQLQQFNHCMGATTTHAGQDDTNATTAPPIGAVKMTASAQLHEACNQFCQSVRQGSLATIKSVVEGAQVIVTAPVSAPNYGSRASSSSSLVSSSGGGALRQVLGEVVHLDETFACVDYIDLVDAQSDVLFYSTRSTMFNNVAVEDVIEENDVWSDGTHVYIARRGGVYDTLQKIPLDRLRTDPSWLKEKIEQNRTDDLGCFLNADIFQSIVSEFIDEDWRPSCLALLDRMREILRVTVQRVVQETTGGTAGRSRTRFPGLQKWLVQQCRKVADDLIQHAYQQVESHLMMEKQHPYTQDHNLFQNMAQARHANLKRELEVALRLDQPESQQQQLKLSNGKHTSSTMVQNTSHVAVQSILDEVFERHSKKSVEDHMAEEMEIVLEAYGSIATRRVMDRTPMICWQVYRSITAAMQDTLYCSVTDEILEKQILRQAPDFEKRYSQLTQELKEWSQALEIVESVM